MNHFWKYKSRSEQLRRINIIRKDSGWCKSDIFGRCKMCNSLTIKGDCVKKSLIVVCCECGAVREVDGVFRSCNKKYKDHNISHGICEDCHQKLYPGMLGRIRKKSEIDNGVYK